MARKAAPVTARMRCADVLRLKGTKAKKAKRNQNSGIRRNPTSVFGNRPGGLSLLRSGFRTGTSTRFGDAFDNAPDLLLRKPALCGTREVGLRDHPDTTALLIDNRHAPYLPIGHDFFNVLEVIVRAAAARLRYGLRRWR